MAMVNRLAMQRVGVAGLLLLTLTWLGLGVAEAAERRLALVIGNSSYSFGALDNPKNDAALMAKTLKAVGFEVTSLIDADQKTMKKAMLEFGRSLRDSDSVGLFYYAGHGVQVDGENYLVPVGANIRDEADVAVESVAASELLRTMQRSASRINIAIFDACRNNPFASSTRSGTRGLARIDAPAGTIIAYATAPGDVALDGQGGNSPYAKALAKNMSADGLTVEEVFKRARREVLTSTGNKQTPWESSSLTGDFYFKPGTTPVGNDGAGSVVEIPSGPEDERLVEVKAYEAIRDSDDPASLKEFLGRFRESMFADLVKLKLGKLEPGASGGGDAVEIAVNVDPDSPEGLFREGQRLELGQGVAADPARAADFYRQAADRGHTGAMTALGGLFEQGSGVDHDAKEAVRWYRSAADKGDVRGMTQLASLYETGTGLTRNETEAASLYRRAASQGSAKALNSLGLMLRDGRGVPKDDNEAFLVFQKAAGLDFPNAMHNLAEAYAKGRGTQRNMGEAVRWYQRAAEKGYAPARASLAALLEFGEGVPKDLDEAVRLYRQSADEGDPAAMTSLAYILEQGKGVPQDLAEAAALYGKAAGAGDARAMHNLAAMLHEGRGVAPDYARAAKLYQSAVDKGYTAAMRGLAVLYDEGKGVRRDPAKAAALVLEAFKRGHKPSRDELLQRPETWSEATRKEIQQALRRAGLYKGRVNGKFGPDVTAALRSFGKQK
ncbi:MAG: caspase family protein [Hyphomicrobiaceae bacterium]